MKSFFLSLTFLTVLCLQVFGQKSAVIGTLISRPNAILVLNPPDRNQGFLLPQLTTSERTSISPTAPGDNGLIVFDTNEKSFYYWKDGAWVKGLGADPIAPGIAFNPITAILSITGGSQADLSSLKEIPPVAGNSGRFLTTDGTTISWATINASGDITAVIAGQGLTGGSTSGDATININTDGTSIAVNGSNAIGIVNGGVTNAKLAVSAVNSNNIADGTVSVADLSPGAVNTTHIISGGNDKVLTTNAGGVVTWLDKSSFDDNQNISLFGNLLNIENATGVDLNDLTVGGTQLTGTLDALSIAPNAVTGTELADDAVDAAAIQDGAIGPSKISSGGNNKVLTTNGAGAVTWSDAVSFADNQDLALAGNTLNISDGSGVDLNNITVGGSQISGTINSLTISPNAITDIQIADAAVNASAIQDGVISTTKISSGGNDKVLTTTAGGVVTWADRASFSDDNQNLILAGNVLGITDGAGVDLNDVTVGGTKISGTLDALAIMSNAVTSSELADDAVDGAAIQDGAVSTIKISSGGNDKVLTTSAGGVVAWADRSTFTDDNQDLSLTGNVLNITDGTGVDLNGVTVGGTQLSGTLNALTISSNAVTDAQLADNAVDNAAIQNSAVSTTKIAPGGNDKVLTTSAGGVVTWADRSTFTDDNQNLSLTGNMLNITDGTGINLNAITTTGDVTGTLNATTVTRIQGFNVSNTTPNTNDMLVWNGSAWVPQNVSVSSPTVQYYAVDPSAFTGLEPTNGNDKTNLGLYQDDNTFVTANADGRQIMAPVNLPHGATINRITVYYSDLSVLGDFTIALYRKTFSGGNETLTTRSTSLVTVGVANFDLPNITPAAERVIDNSNYSYRIHVTFTTSSSGPGLLDQRLYGIRIEYAK